MAFTEEQFDALVKRLETIAQQRPGTYKLRVGLLALLGYAYIALVLVALLGLVALLVWFVMESRRLHGGVIQVGTAVLVLTWIVLRSLFVAFTPPQGLELRRSQAGNLFALVNQLTTQLEALQVHHILLTRDFNASVVQIPRLGILGWHRNYLIIGLPLMQALSVNQFRAVLAHELGHLSGNHSKFNAWIYRIRKTWIQILQRLYQSGNEGGSLLFNPFFNWYTPFFNAYSFVLGRMNEYEADRCAAELAGAKNAAEALVMAELRARYLEETYWKHLYKRVNEEVEPPAIAYTNLLEALKTDPDPTDSQIWLNQALSRKTDNADTHPCLSDRLKALGIQPTQQQNFVATGVQNSAAEKLLGSFLPTVLAQFDADWKTEVATSWRQHYAYAQEMQKQRRALEEKAKTEVLTLEEEWNRVVWTLEFEELPVALPVLQAFLQAHPEQVDANYMLGQILLRQGDIAGIAHIERAMAKDTTTVLPGCEVIYAFLKQQGRLKEAQTYADRWEQHQRVVDRASQERMKVSDRDTFTPHNLPSGTVALLQKQLENLPQVQEAYLVQKVVKHLPEQPLYVLAVMRQVKWNELDSAQINSVFLNEVANGLKFPHGGFVVVLAAGRLRDRLRQIAESQIR